MWLPGHGPGYLARGRRTFHCYTVAFQSANARAGFEVCLPTSHFEGGFLGEACFRQADKAGRPEYVTPAHVGGRESRRATDRVELRYYSQSNSR